MKVIFARIDEIFDLIFKDVDYSYFFKNDEKSILSGGESELQRRLEDFATNCILIDLIFVPLCSDLKNNQDDD